MIINSRLGQWKTLQTLGLLRQTNVPICVKMTAKRKANGSRMLSCVQRSMCPVSFRGSHTYSLTIAYYYCHAARMYKTGTKKIHFCLFESVPGLNGIFLTYVFYRCSLLCLFLQRNKKNFPFFLAAKVDGWISEHFWSFTLTSTCILYLHHTVESVTKTLTSDSCFSLNYRNKNLQRKDSSYLRHSTGSYCTKPILNTTCTHDSLSWYIQYIIQYLVL